MRTTDQRPEKTGFVTRVLVTYSTDLKYHLIFHLIVQFGIFAHQSEHQDGKARTAAVANGFRVKPNPVPAHEWYIF